MKAVIIILVLVVGGWCAYSYFTTGRIAAPSFGCASQSEDDQALDKLSTRLAQAESLYRGANRAAGRAVDTTREIENAMKDVQAVLDETRALKPKLRGDEAKKRADEIVQRAEHALSRTK
jgi:hypothetical protein